MTQNKCNKKTEIYSRVVGFFRPMDSWNIGKQEEAKEKKYYKLQNLSPENKKCY